MSDSGAASAAVKIRRPVGKAGRRPPTILRVADRARRSGDASDDSDDWVTVERPQDRTEEAGEFDGVEEVEEAAGGIDETEEPLADPSPEQQDEDEKEKEAAKPRLPRGAVPLPGALLLPGGGLPMPRLRPSRAPEEKEEEKKEKEKEKEKDKKEKEKEKEKEKDKKEKDSAPTEGRSKVPPPRPVLPPQGARVLPAGPVAAPRLRRTNTDETPAKSPPPRPPRPQKPTVAKDNEKRTDSASKSGKESKE